MKRILLFAFTLCGAFASALASDPFVPDRGNPPMIEGMSLVFNEEFNYTGKPDSLTWDYEIGFIRNQELQWYQCDNANCRDGRLLIEARKTDFENPNYVPNSKDWRKNRQRVSYTSACIKTKDKKVWKYGRFEIRARIDTAMGAWPAIWTLGEDNPWPQCGEVDILEFYRPKKVPSILANVAWGSDKTSSGSWHTTVHPLTNFASADQDWVRKYHVWRMDWTKDSIRLYVDDYLLNATALSDTTNPDGTNPFMQPHYLLLNLALGQGGDDPSNSKFPITFEVDYVRIYQQNY